VNTKTRRRSNNAHTLWHYIWFRFSGDCTFNIRCIISGPPIDLTRCIETIGVKTSVPILRDPIHRPPSLFACCLYEYFLFEDITYSNQLVSYFEMNNYAHSKDISIDLNSKQSALMHKFRAGIVPEFIPFDVLIT
jgi:hypothetical protein